MSGRYTGMQATPKNKNSATFFILCEARLFNFVGQGTASCFVEAINYFGFIQNLYIFLPCQHTDGQI